MKADADAASGRIDVHHHVIPPLYAAFLASRGVAEAGGRATPRWSLDDALSLMDLVGIRTAILSVSTPGTAPARDPSEAALVARDVNDFAASLVSDRPDRLGFFATVPLPDIEAANNEPSARSTSSRPTASSCSPMLPAATLAPPRTTSSSPNSMRARR